MEYTEKTVSTERVYEGRVINFKVDTVTLPNGRTATRELVEHPGGVGVVAIDEDGCVLLVEQFRKPYEKMITEIPAGKLEKGEDPELCGRRELEEETGRRAASFEYLGECYPSVGYTNEIIRIYLAKGLTKTHQHLDDDEFLNVKKMPLSEMVEKIMRNEVADAKTVMGVLKTAIKDGLV